MTIADTFGRACRSARIGLDLTQAELGEAVGLTRGYIAKVEAGSANVTLTAVERIGAALGLALHLVATPPVFLGTRAAHDLVHSWCSASVRRRLTGSGWQLEPEVDLSDGRVHGWADLVAFHPRNSTLVIIEIKTRLDDFGGMQRQIAWYERHARQAAVRFGWRPRKVAVWLICLSSAEVDHVLVLHRDVLERGFPDRSRSMLAVIRGEQVPAARGLAMIDPSSRRADWLLATTIDGRRVRPAYDGYADAARTIARRRRSG